MQPLKAQVSIEEDHSVAPAGSGSPLTLKMDTEGSLETSRIPSMVIGAIMTPWF